MWEPAKRESGTDFTLYDLRHTFASRLLAAGIPLTEVAAWMGHSLRAGGAPVNTTTETYAHATGEHRSERLASCTPSSQGELSMRLLWARSPNSTSARKSDVPHEHADIALPLRAPPEFVPHRTPARDEKAERRDDERRCFRAAKVKRARYSIVSPSP